MDQTLIDKTNKLKLYLCCTGVTIAELANGIGYSRVLISAYLHGKKRLGKKAAKAIELFTRGQVTFDDIVRFNPALEKNMIEYKPREGV